MGRRSRRNEVPHDGWIEHTKVGYPPGLLYRYGRSGDDGPAPFEKKLPPVTPVAAMTARQPETPAAPPQPAGEAASVQAHDAAATPGTSPAPPVAGEDVPGTPGPPSSLPLGRQEGSEGGVQKWVVELPAGLRLLSLNDRIHWSVKGRITRDLRKAAFVMARNAGVPRLERARVVVEYQPPQVTRRRDLDNVGPASGKPCIDGLVDAKVLADDSPRYLAEVAYRIGEPFPRGRLVLHVEAVGQ